MADADVLCSLTNLKTILTISGTGEDGRLEDALHHATNMILTYIDRTIVQTSYTEYRDGTGTPFLNLHHYPLIGNPTTVNVDNDRDFPASLNLDVDDDYLVESAEGILRIVMSPIFGLGQAIWPLGVQNVKVVYSAGYATVPRDLERICGEFAAFLYKERGGQRANLTTSVGGIKTQYSQEAIPKVFQLALDPWRRQDTEFDFLEAMVL